MTAHMKRFEHGGDIYTHVGVVDFSANINPLGMPEVAVQALIDNVANYEAYPDIACRELREAIARAEGVPAEYIICTAGATDLLHRICAALKPHAGLVTAPCFSGYEQALEQSGAEIVRLALDDTDDFGVTDSILGFSKRAAAGVAPTTPASILFLCNPNNPTGLTIAPDLLGRILDEAREAGILVVLDECFLDFTDEPTAVPKCADYPNLIVMRAFTKMYAMAGLRLGYGICSDAELLARLEAAGQQWAVSTPAQVAGLAALGVDGWVQRTRAYVAEQRARLADGLAACGMRVVPGKANYLMLRSEFPLYDALLERGFLIRRCENYAGLDEGWYRVAVRTAEENEAFLAALREVCDNQGNLSESVDSASGVGNADDADSAGGADGADNADDADSASSADSADDASSAGNVDSASNADNADSLPRSSTTKEVCA